MSWPLLWCKMHLMVRSCYKTVIGTDTFSKCKWSLSCYFVIHSIFFMSLFVPCPVLWSQRSHRLAVNGWLVCHLLLLYLYLSSSVVVVSVCTVFFSMDWWLSCFDWLTIVSRSISLVHQQTNHQMTYAQFKFPPAGDLHSLTSQHWSYSLISIIPYQIHCHHW